MAAGDYDREIERLELGIEIELNILSTRLNTYVSGLRVLVEAMIELHDLRRSDYRGVDGDDESY